MPTIITHAITGAGAAASWAPPDKKALFWFLSLSLPMLPDADIVSSAIGLPYDHFWGHRGFFHSLPFAGAVSVVVTSLFFREHRPFSVGWWKLATYFSMLIGSHGILDAMTSGGDGVALFSPLTDRRFFFDFRPILVSPIGLQSFLSYRGFRTLVSEAIWIWLPLSVLVGGIIAWRRGRKERSSF